MDKISVIVPVYNVEKYVEKCLESIIRQTYKELEIIVIDDGSTDASGVICDEFQKKDSRIRVVHQENQGLSESRNKGIEMATGGYLVFIDSDDYISDELCKGCIQVFHKHDVDIVVFGYQEIDEYGKILKNEKMGESFIAGTQVALECLINGNAGNYAWNKIYKAELFDKIRYPKGRSWEDIGTTYKVFDQANEVYFMNQIYYYYLKRWGGITSQTSLKGLIDIYQQEKERYNYFLLRNKKLAGMTLEKMCCAAVRLCVEEAYDQPDKIVVDEAKKYLDDNEKAIKSNRNLMRYGCIKCYYISPWLYQKMVSFVDKIRIIRIYKRRLFGKAKS